MPQTIITKEMLETAWEVTREALETLHRNGFANNNNGHIVVLSPIDGTVIFEESINDDTPKKYLDFAYAKSQVSWREGKPSRVVQQEATFLYQDGDVKFGGSSVRDGFVVAFSGVQSVYDEMLSEVFISAIVAMCRDEMTKPDGILADESSWIGGESFAP